MKYFFDKDIQIGHDTAITIGKFDGLHRGHMHLAGELQRIAAQNTLATVILSFWPHPAQFFSGKGAHLILARQEKIHLLEQMGIDYYIEYPFTAAFAGMRPEDFVTDILVNKLCCRVLVVGQGYRFGAGGAGDVALLEKLGRQLGFATHVVNHVDSKDGKISAADLRCSIVNGNLAKVKELTGRDYFIMGQVGLDKKIILCTNKLLPPCGTYITITHVDGEKFGSITKINEKFVVENHIVDFVGDMRGKTVCVDFIRRFEEN
ncbi:MAG: hypothetical protein FWC93_03700 [Defluviitaleaceae bacterium]|nr:hypothetical protein [Defluviitaleaceae bacterium]